VKASHASFGQRAAALTLLAGLPLALLAVGWAGVRFGAAGLGDHLGALNRSVAVARPLGPATVSTTPMQSAAAPSAVGAELTAATAAPAAEVAGITLANGEVLTPQSEWHPVSRISIPRLALDVPVTISPFVEKNGSGSWTIPAFVPGHAEFTASAGAAGNAVLFGHVVHPSEGSVFRDVHLLRRGDRISVESKGPVYDYTVTEVVRVSRTDVWVLGRTEEPVLTLVTCTGQWLPQVQDYAERLVVRARLDQSL
jgi:LPXTG-site transpeptidase (sortase) family protein